MSDENETSPNTAMDKGIDRELNPTLPSSETYSKNAEGGLPLADARNPVSDYQAPKLTSWTMSEIDRVVAREILPNTRTKIDTFAIQMHRKTDLRMRALSRQFGTLLKRTHLAEMTTGPETNRVREFDIQSQTMRAVAANAAMGMYQFQKNSTLPYMRKSLALSYQKVALLKNISGGISSLEKALLSKLEAIKVNTAAGVPRQTGYFGKLKKDVMDLNRQRVAGNISKYMLTKKEEWYNNTVSPITNRIHEQLSNTSKTGGLKGIRRDALSQVGKLRREHRDLAQSDTTTAGRFQKAKVFGAKYTSKALGGVLKVGKRFNLSSERNRAWSDKLAPHGDDLRKFNPFGTGWDERLGDTDTPKENAGFAKELKASFDDWRKEYRTDHDKMIATLSSINDKMAGAVEDATGIPQKTKRNRKARAKKPLGAMGSPAVSQEESPPVSDTAEAPAAKRSIFTRFKEMSFRKNITGEGASPVKTDSNLLSPVGGDNKASVPDSPERRGNLSNLVGKITTPFSTPAIANLLKPITPVTAAAQSPSSHVDMYRLQASTNSLRQQSDIDRAFVTKMFDRLGGKVDSVTTTVDQGNTERSKFEKVQTKWKALTDKLIPKKTRKNSYDEVLENKAKDQERKSLLGRTGDRLKDLALGTGAKLASGDLIGAAGSATGDLVDWAKDEVGEVVGNKLEEAGDNLADRAGKKASRFARKSRILRSSRGRSLARAVGRGGAARAAASATASTALGAAGKKGLLSKVGSLAWRGAKGTVRGGGKLALGATKGVAKGGWGLTKLAAGLSGKAVVKSAPLIGKGLLTATKSLGPALAVGLGADYAKDWFANNTTGTTQRLGNTAATMASWGATGATVGSIVPVLGTGAGAAVGAGLGALAANIDLVRKGLSWAGNKAFDGLDTIGAAGSFAWKNLFGSDAKFDKMGRVKEKETPSLLGHVGTLFFGRDAKYAKSGDIISSGKSGIVPELRKGFDLFFFGVKDPKEKSKFKAGSSMLAKLTTSFMSTFDSFKKSMSELPGKIAESLKGLGQKASELAGEVGTGISGITDWAAETVRGAFDPKANPVTNAKAIAEQLIPGIVVTSHTRPAGAAGKAGARSWHVKSGAAIDVRPIPGMTYEAFKRRFTDAGYSIIEDIDETSPAAMAKTGATGPHWHIVLGEKKQNPGGSSDYTMTPKAPQPVYKGNGSTLMKSGNSNPHASANAWGTGSTQNGSSTNPAQSSPSYATGQGGSKAVAAAGGSLFSKATSHLMSKGWSKTAALGIVANLHGESNLNTVAFNPDEGGQGAKGIAQWRGPRITEIEAKWGKPIGKMSLTEQLDAVDMELREGRHVTAEPAIRNGTTPIVEAINNAPNFESVVQQMVHRFERPSKTTAGREAESNRRIQKGYALVGGFGKDAPAAPAKKPPVQMAAAKPKPAAPKPAAAKPKSEAAPTKKTTEDSWTGELLSTMNDMKNYFKSDSASAKTPTTNNTVVAPIINAGGNKSSWGTAGSTTMSMSKTSVRTGN